MTRLSLLATPLCIVLSLLMLLDYTVFNVPSAVALDRKSALVGAAAGAAAGAGVVLAAPAIAGAVGAAGGIAGIGTAIVGGVAAAGGALLGVVSAVGGAIAAGIGAVGGFLVGIVASPLFIPALVVIGAVALGVFLYRRHRRQQRVDVPVIPDSDFITVTPGDYDMSPVLNPSAPDPITIGDDDVITIPGSDIAVGVAPPSVSPPVLPGISDTTPGVIAPPDAKGDAELAAAHQRYIQAYTEYTQLVTTGGTGDVREALARYRAAYSEYMLLKRASQGR